MFPNLLFASELSRFYSLAWKEQGMSFLEKKANKRQNAGIMGSPTNPGAQMRLFSAIKMNIFFGSS